MGALHQELAARSKGDCQLCAFLVGLEPADRAEWKEELALPAKIIGDVAVRKGLELRGVVTTEARIRWHRGHHGSA